MNKQTAEELYKISEQNYEELLSLWADLESALHMVLLHPEKVQGLAKKLDELYQWQTDLIVQDSDAALYLMFQIASISTVGYSASHALVCSALAQILAPRLQMTQEETRRLCLSAMTMNIGMTRMQDALAQQVDKPSAAQKECIDTHPALGRKLLVDCGVDDEVWLDVIGNHHRPPVDKKRLSKLTEAQKLTRILAIIDRYAAMISPRKSRAARSVTESLKAIIGQRFDPKDEVAIALSEVIGNHPPGTLVKLENMDVAIVLRRSQCANEPLLASIVNGRNELHDPPPLFFASHGGPRIVASLPRSALNFRLSHKTMISLGLFAAQHNLNLLKQLPTR